MSTTTTTLEGIDAIRRFIEKEIVGDNIAMDVREVVHHYGDTIVRAAYEGDFDRSSLPDGDVILTNYFSVRDGKIVSLVTINNRPADPARGLAGTAPKRQRSTRPSPTAAPTPAVRTSQSAQTQDDPSHITSLTTSCGPPPAGGCPALLSASRTALRRRPAPPHGHDDARRHAQRADVRARSADRRRADDEHLLDLSGRADRVPAAP